MTASISRRLAAIEERAAATRPSPADRRQTQIEAHFKAMSTPDLERIVAILEKVERGVVLDEAENADGERILGPLVMHIHAYP